MKSGWNGERHRHSMAAKGVITKINNKNPKIISEKEIKQTSKLLYVTAKMNLEGFGFWGTIENIDPYDFHKYVEHFVKTMKNRGYNDLEILMWGNTKFGRHLVDELSSKPTIEHFDKLIEKYLKYQPVIAIYKLYEPKDFDIYKEYIIETKKLNR